MGLSAHQRVRLEGERGLIRDSEGRWIKGYLSCLGITDSLLAERWALRDGLILARDLDIQNLIVELDAKVAIDLIWGSTRENLV